MRKAVVVLVGMACALAGRAFGVDDDARTARARDIRMALDALNAEVAAHGGTFESWSRELRDYREDLQHLGKVQARDDLQFQAQSARVIRCDDLDALPEGCRPFDPILRFDRQLKARGIDLVLAIIPSKLCVYPDFLNVAPGKPARAPADRQVAVCVKRLYRKLLENDVEVIDLYTAFQDARKTTGDSVPYVYQADSHWKNAGCRIAAERIADRLKRYDFVRGALSGGNPYTGRPGSRGDAQKADPDLLIVQEKGGKLYWDVEDSPVIVTGDSYSMYNFNPNVPAHLSAQVALRIGVPVTLLGGSGLSYQMPLKMAELVRQKDYLKGRRVVVWTFNDKMLPLSPGKDGWAQVELPACAGPAETGVAAGASLPGPGGVVTVTVAEVSAPPPRDAPYPNFYRLAYARDLPDSKDGVLHILAMHRRKVLPSASLRPGDRVGVRLSPWAPLEKTHGRIQSGTLPTAELQVTRPHYLAEVPGYPSLSASDLGKAGEE